MPGRGSGSSDTSSSSVPEQQEARYRGLEWRTASKKGEGDMRERWMDHRSRSLAGLLVVVIVAMGPGGSGKGRVGEEGRTRWVAGHLKKKKKRSGSWCTNEETV